MIKLRSDRLIVKIRPLARLPMNLISVDVGKTWAKDQLEAEVMAVGPDVTEVQVGDILVVTGEAGHWMDRGTFDPEDKDSTYRHLRESDSGILGILESVKTEMEVLA